MEKLSKNRGVISVFLLVIFVVTYVAMGMLVDAARYRMSRTYAEAVLDMATESILASYNNMLFELYGLFGADVEMDGKTVEEALKDTYTKYLNSVFEALSIEEDSDTTELVRLLSDSLFEDEDNQYLTVRQLYRFEIEELDAGTSVTLANTANVESQIIEYMKFRAPVEIIGGLAGESGFLEKLNGLLQFKDRVAVAHEAEKLSEEFKKGNVPKEAKELLGEINAFANRLYDFSTTSGKKYDQLSPAKKEGIDNPSNVWTVYQRFDTNVSNAETEYNKSVQGIIEDFHRWLRELLEDAQKDVPEIILEDFYKKKETMTEKTNVFQEINIDGITNGDEIEKLAEDVSEKLGGTFATDYGNYCNDRDSNINKAGVTRNTALDTALNNFKNVFVYREEAAGRLYQASLALEEKIMELTEEYKAQIETMKAAFNEKPDNEHYKTVFLPKIELLEANAAEIIKNLDLLNSCRPYLKEWFEGFYENKYKASEWLFYEASQIIDAHKALESEVTGNSIASLCTRLKKAERFYETHKDGYSENSVYHLEDKEFHPNTYDAAAVALTETITEYLCVLYSHASYFQKNYYHGDVDVKDTITQQQKNRREEAEKERPDKDGVDTEAIKEHPEWLTEIVPPSEMLEEPGEDFSEFSYEGSAFKVMKTGLNLFDKIAGFLEGLRDNLYVDAYVMTHFPNYAEHYVKPDSEEAKEFLGTYGGYCASLAEVEYIISGIMRDVGEGFGSKSVSSVQGKLFCIRMLFNTLAIFTDSAKLQQATVLAAPAGPFAPLVAAALLAVWAAAESGIDVTKLVNGKEVPVFKQGSQWFFSVDGAFKEGVKMILGMALGKAEDIAADYMNLVIDGMEANLNRMIYEAYTSESHDRASIEQIVNRGLGIAGTGLGAAQENALGYGAQLCENIQNLKDEDGNPLMGDDVKQKVAEAGDAYAKAVTKAAGKLDGYLENLKSGVGKIEDNILNMRAASRIAVEAKKAARNTLGTITTKLGNDAAKTISEHLSKVIPVGQVQNTGGFDDSKTIKFSYTDYLWFFLVIMNQETKVQRIQEMIQVNMRYYYVSQGKTSNPVGDFALERIPVAVWADLDYSIRLFFLSNGIVPEEFQVRDKDGKESGRLKQRVISAQSY